jgi:hypothetical protein
MTFKAPHSQGEEEVRRETKRPPTWGSDNVAVTSRRWSYFALI